MNSKERLLKIKRRIDEIAIKSGRNPEEIKLLAVSKNHSLDKMQQVLAEGICDFGESRVQELQDKYSFSNKVAWHMIGHLQRNKVKYLVRMDRCELIHSLDSLRLAKKINKEARKEDRVMNLLVQVNVAEDSKKYGLFCEETFDFIKKIADFENLKVKGLMTIAPYVGDVEEVRPYFRRLRNLFERIKEAEIRGVEMEELSMGMSNDFEVAIEEGATIVRIGSGIFGAREYK